MGGDTGRSTVDARRRALLKAAAGLAFAAAGGPWRAVRGQSPDGPIALAPLRGPCVLVTGAGGNVVLAPTTDGSVLVDSGAPERARELAAAVAERTREAPVRLLLNTHWHLDHTGGNETLARADTTIAAHENTRLWMSTKFYVEWEDRYYTPRPAAARPNETFFSSDPQPLRATVGGVALEYGHLLEAHTDGDIYVRFPEHNVIVAGGTATVGRYPVLDYITGGWIGGLVDATAKLIAMSDDETLIVPDAGPPQRRADLEAQRTMLETVRERIEAIALQGRGVEDMIEENVTRGFEERYGTDSARFIENAYEGLWWNRLRGIVA